MIFLKNPSLKKNHFFGGGEGKEGLASMSAFVLQIFQIKKKIFEGGGGGGGGEGGR